MAYVYYNQPTAGTKMATVQNGSSEHVQKLVLCKGSDGSVQPDILPVSIDQTTAGTTNGVANYLYHLNDGWVKPGVDAWSTAQFFIEFEHHHVHEGRAFYASQHAATLANDATVTILMVTSSTTGEECHAVFDVSVSGESTWEITSDVTATASVTALTCPPANRNRNSSNTAATALTLTPTSVSGGTLIHSERIGAGKSNAGTTHSGGEIALKRAAKTLLTLTNKSGGNINYNIGINWYEHGTSGLEARGQ